MSIRKILWVGMACGLAIPLTGQAATQWSFDTTTPLPIPCASSGTSVGNTISCTPLPGNYVGDLNPADNVTVKAFSNTGTSGTLANAYVGVYTGGLGVGNTVEGGTTATNPNHGIDNAGSDGRFDSVLLSFNSKTTLTGVTIGWHNTVTSYPTAADRGTDSDLTVFAYVGGSANPIVTGTTTYSSIKAATADWKFIGNYANLVDNAVKAVNTGANTGGTAIATRFWLISTYNPMGGSTAAGFSTGDEFVKISSVEGVQQSVPEPGSLALLGLAAGAGIVVRRLNKKIRSRSV